MAEHQVYHVIRKGDDTWEVLKEGFKRPHLVGHSKAEAVLLAKRLAKSNAEARVVVHNDENLVESVFRFRSPPEPHEEKNRQC